MVYYNLVGGEYSRRMCYKDLKSFVNAGTLCHVKTPDIKGPNIAQCARSRMCVYQPDAIAEWLARNPTSPITRTPMEMPDLYPNRALQRVIESATPIQHVSVAQRVQSWPPIPPAASAPHADQVDEGRLIAALAASRP